MYFMELNFQVEGDLDANCFFFIVGFERKSLLFQFLSVGMGMHIFTLTGVQNGPIKRRKCRILMKNVLLKLNF